MTLFMTRGELSRRTPCQVDRADGFVTLTGEYEHGYPAILKNAMDWTFVERRRQPVTFGGWGNETDDLIWWTSALAAARHAGEAEEPVVAGRS